MSEKSWVLRGVDAEARQAALAEAERRGLSLSDYLTEVLLGEALASQIADQPDAESREEPAPLRLGRENFAFRHRVEALERRLTASLGGLDGALQALDSTVLSLGAELDETGALAEDGAAALVDLATNVAALRKRLTDVEDTAEAYIENNEDAHEGFAARCAALEAHLTSVETIAYAADAVGARLTETQEALQRALAQDFNAFAYDSDRRLDAAAGDMRAMAEEAAAHADAAAQRAIEALRLTREALEQNLLEQAEETRAIVQGAFADAAERVDAVADRVLENQRIAQRMGEQLNTRLNDVEDGAHAALEETAETLRQADAALSSQLARAAAEARDGAAALSARQDEAAQRLNTIDFALNNAIADMGALREEARDCLSDAETVFDARHNALEADLRARLEALVTRLDHVTEAAAHDDQQTAANIDRVEACAFAALEKLAGDIAAGDAAQAKQTQDNYNTVAARLSAIDRAVGAQVQAAGQLRSRVERLESSDHDQKLAALTQDMHARLAQLEQTAGDAGDAQTLAALTEELASLSKQVREDDAPAQLAELRVRVEAQNSLINDSADRARGVARMLSRVSAQAADAAAQTEDRLHGLELGVADLRLDIAAKGAVEEIAARIEAMEDSQADALEALRAEIAHFIGENDRRLTELEQGGVARLSGDEVLIAHAIEARLTELEQRDVGAAFEDLRRRIEDRILGVERSSVRAIEQMADTIALIEKRYIEGDDEVARSA